MLWHASAVHSRERRQPLGEHRSEAASLLLDGRTGAAVAFATAASTTAAGASSLATTTTCGSWGRGGGFVYVHRQFSPGGGGVSLTVVVASTRSV